MVFKQKHEDGSYIQMKVHREATWQEATDQFLQFLHGCGYVFDSIEVGEHIVEQWSFQREKPKVFINGSEVSLPMPEEWIDQPKSEIKRKKGKKNAKQK